MTTTVALLEVSLASGNPNLPSASLSALRSARAHGAKTVVATADPAFYQGKFDELVDAWVSCDTTRAEHVATALHALQPDALIAFSDLFVTQANEAAMLLGVKHPHSAGSPAVSRDKARVRAALDHAGIANARWGTIKASAERPTSPVGYPAIVKPVDGSGSWDVRRVTCDQELQDACAAHAKRTTYGRNVAPRRQLLCEEELIGDLVSAEGFVRGADVEIWGHSSRTLSDPPYYIETGCAFGAATADGGLDDYVHAVVAATGLRFGAFHMEVILTQAGPVLVELNPRLIGGGVHQCIDLASGGDSAGTIVANYLGQDQEIPTPGMSSAIARIVAAEPGKVVSITGLEEARTSPGVVHVVCPKSIGDSLTVTHSNDDRFGYVLAVGDTRGRAQELADAAAALIQVEISNTSHSDQATG